MSAEPTPATRRRLPAWVRTPAALYLGVGLLSLLGSAAAALVLPRYVPNGADEFANLLAGQTFARGALTNPPHPLWEFFETHHVLLQPTYMAKYPPAQGLFLALGLWLGHPLFGVWVASALFASATAWMARGVFSPRWALLAGVLAIGQFGLGCFWSQSYWGGAPAALGGALVFGGTRRVLRSGTAGDAAWLGAGVVLLLFSRPFEGLLVCVVPAALVARALWTGRLSVPRTLPAVAMLAAGMLFQVALNARVTGSPWKMPYTAYEEQYSHIPLFLWEKAGPDPHFRHPSMANLYHLYVKPLSRHGAPLLTVWWDRAVITMRYQLGWVLGPIALAGLFLRPTRWAGFAWLAAATASGAFVLTFWFFYHYEAPMAAFLLFAAVHGLRALLLARCWRHQLGWLSLGLTLAYASAVAADTDLKQIHLNEFSPTRQALVDHLTAAGGRHLIIVRLQNPRNLHFDWVYNDARIDASAVVWARDCGEEENRRLVDYFHDRTIVLMIDGPGGITFVPYVPATPGIKPSRAKP